MKNGSSRRLAAAGIWLSVAIPLCAAGVIRRQRPQPVSVTGETAARRLRQEARPANSRFAKAEGVSMVPAVTCVAAGVPVQAPPLTAGVTVTGDTTAGTSALNGYAQGGTPYAADWGGQELVYQFTTASTGNIRAFIDPNAGVDVDVFILSACDTDRVLSVGDNAAVALAQPAGTYFIVIDTYGYGAGPFTYYPGVFNLTVVNSAGLLLVDDDGSGDATQCGGTCPNVRTSYSNALTAAGFTYTVWDVATQGSPSLPTLGLYKTVLWFTAFTYEPGKTLTPTDQANLRMFSQLGGRVMITGHDIMFDLLGGVDGRLPDGSVLNDRFQIGSVANDIDTIPGAAACPSNSSYTGTASISGTIRDQSAVALVGQRICFDGGGNGAHGSVVSTAGGAYSIANLPAGTYTYWLPVGSSSSPTSLKSVLTTGASTGRDFTVQASPWPPGRTLTGVPGNPISSDLTTGTLQTFNLTASLFTPYTDTLTSRYGEPLYFTADHRPAGFMYDAGGFFTQIPYSKTIFLAFAPELDTTTSRMTTLLTRAVNWLNNDSDFCDYGGATATVEGKETFTDGATVNGYPDPGETVTYHLTLTNHDTISHVFKVGFAAQQTFVTPTPPLYVTTPSVAPAGTAMVNFPLVIAPSTVAAPTIRTGESLSRAYNVVADGAYCHSAGYGSFVGQAQILLVKDEELTPNTTGIDVYTSALNKLGRTYALWDTAQFSHPTYSVLPTENLPNERMSPYSAVIWLTGADNFITLTSDGAVLPGLPGTGEVDPEAELTALLNATTGRLFLTSQDYLFDKYLGLSQDIPPADFAYTQLKLQHVNQDVVRDTTDNVATVSGVWATEAAYNTLTTNFINNYADGTLLRSGVTGASLLANYQNTGFPAGSVRKCIAGTDCGATSTNGLKMVFMPYAFENLADGGGASNKQRMIEKILCQFQTTSSTPPCGYSPPAPSMNTITIMPEKPAGVPDFFWDDGRVACNGDTIGGPWQVFGATTPSGAGVFLRNAIESTPIYTPASETPPAGTGEFYTVRYFDAFGTAPVAVCP